MALTKQNLFALLLLLPMLLGAQLPRSDWEKMKLQGKVKSLKEIQVGNYQDTSDYQDSYQRQIIAYNFDSSGFLISKSVHYIHSLNQFTLRYQYSACRDTIRIFYHDKHNISHLKHIVISNPSKLQSIDSTFSLNGKLSAIYKYKHDKIGRTLEMKGYNSRKNDSLFVQESFKYDSLGNLLTKESSISSFHRKYQYQNQRIVSIQQQLITKRDTINRTEKLAYNKAGLVQKISFIYNNEIPYSEHFSYDKNFNCILKISRDYYGIKSKTSETRTLRKIEYYP